MFLQQHGIPLHMPMQPCRRAHQHPQADAEPVGQVEVTWERGVPASIGVVDDARDVEARIPGQQALAVFADDVRVVLQTSALSTRCPQWFSTGPGLYRWVLIGYGWLP